MKQTKNVDFLISLKQSYLMIIPPPHTLTLGNGITKIHLPV